MASEDLDICISSLTGHHFATLLESYIHLQSSNTTDPAIIKTKIAKIQANPDQSKHLETARMHVLGMEVDLVQLRSEEYANGTAEGDGGSRIPTSIVGQQFQGHARAQSDVLLWNCRSSAHRLKTHYGEISLSTPYSTTSTHEKWKIGLTRQDYLSVL